MIEDASKGSIIVVDDEQAVRDMISRALRKEGYSVVTAKDGYDALEKVSQAHFDLMFLDIRMPEISGLEVLSIMNAHHPATTVVMLTAVNGAQAEARSHEAFAYLRKPCKIAEVIAMANKFLGGNVNLP
ncbi:MAG: response regulator [Dehalococcoidia bacterium]|nr:response regulator [Dehalococcoidia bacterium]